MTQIKRENTAFLTAINSKHAVALVWIAAQGTRVGNVCSIHGTTARMNTCPVFRKLLINSNYSANESHSSTKPGLKSLPSVASVNAYKTSYFKQ